MQAEKEELWRPIVGLENFYEVSSLGQVRSIPRRASIGRASRTVRARQMKLSPDRGGYLRFNASSHPGYLTVRVHRAVADAFLSSPPGPIGAGSLDFCVNHINGDKTDNRVSNLEWLTGAESRRDAGNSGLLAHGKGHHGAKLDEGRVREIRELAATHTQAELASLFSVSQSRISVIVSRKQWRHVK